MTRVIVVRGIVMLFVCWAAVAVGCSQDIQVLPVVVEQEVAPVPCPEFVADTTIRI